MLSMRCHHDVNEILMPVDVTMSNYVISTNREVVNVKNNVEGNINTDDPITAKKDGPTD